MVVKIQQSLHSSDNQKWLLIYDEERNHHAQIEATEDVLKLLNGRPKAYFEAQINKDKMLVIEKEVPNPGW